MIRSFLSALAGLTVGVSAMMLLSGALFASHAIFAAFFVIIVGGPVVLVVWLCLLWPLFALVPRTSKLWQPWICVPCGVVAGVLLLMAAFPFYGVAPWEIWHFSYFYVGPIVGGVTCTVGCALKTSEPISAEPPLLSRLYRRVVLLWQRVERRVRIVFSAWSGQ